MQRLCEPNSGPYGPADQSIVIARISLYKGRILAVNLTWGPVDLDNIARFLLDIVIDTFDCATTESLVLPTASSPPAPLPAGRIAGDRTSKTVRTERQSAQGFTPLVQSHYLCGGENDAYRPRMGSTASRVGCPDEPGPLVIADGGRCGRGSTS